MASYGEIVAAFAGTGLAVRGGFTLAGHEPAPTMGDGPPARAIVLIGNFGDMLWQQFAPHAGEAPDPLDTWTKARVRPSPNASAPWPCSRAIGPISPSSNGRCAPSR
ncbi:MAG: hypothetical protein R3D33_14105 [Hyphomicrobiaceae bacterium]